MANEIQDQLKAAIQLAQQGQRDAARGLLLRVVESDPQQELAWLWLAVVSSDRSERLTYLERTLAINPANERALSAYSKLTGKPYVAGISGTRRTPAPEPAADGLRPAAGRIEWTDDLEPRRSPWMTALIVLVTLAVMAGGAYFFASQLLDGDDDETPQRAATALPGGQGANLTRTPAGSATSVFTITPAETPLPTITPGPSPTSIWDNPPPTWTAAPTVTPPPSATPLPSFTPLPTFTPTEAVSFATRTPTSAQPPAGPVTSTPLFSPTP